MCGIESAGPPEENSHDGVEYDDSGAVDVAFAAKLLFKYIKNSEESEIELDAYLRESRKITAEDLYKFRRLRGEIFSDPALFGEPAWDILLDLMVAESKGKQVSVTSSCIAADVPATTALRWLSILEGRGFIERTTDRFDGRRTFVRLSKSGLAKMQNLIDKI